MKENQREKSIMHHTLEQNEALEDWSLSSIPCVWYRDATHLPFIYLFIFDSHS